MTHYSTNIVTLLLFAALSTPTDAAESLACSDPCQIIRCEESSCSMSTCEQGDRSVRGEFEAHTDYISASSDQGYGEGSGIHCGTSRCAVTTCDEHTCNTFGVYRGTSGIIHSVINPALARDRAVRGYLTSSPG